MEIVSATSFLILFAVANDKDGYKAASSWWHIWLLLSVGTEGKIFLNSFWQFSIICSLSDWYNNIKPVIQTKSVAFRIQQYFSLSVRSSKGRPSESLAVQFFYRCRHDAIRKKKKIKSYERHVKGRKSFRRQWRLRARFKWLWKVDNCVAAS